MPERDESRHDSYLREARSNMDQAGYSGIPLDRATLELRWERDRLRRRLDAAAEKFEEVGMPVYAAFCRGELEDRDA